MSDGVIYGNYFLLGRLAQGGMAEVFLGKHLDNSDPDQLLAIKRMLPRFTGDLDFVSMFSDEARIAASLSHPNICKVFDQGEFAGQLYLVMEFIHGKDLKVAQRRADGRGEPIPFRFVAHIIAKIAEALDYAHRKTNADGATENIVHRDVSPQNILISYDGIPKLIDFGIAKARDRLVQTKVGVVKGKFAYMSPEQATGQVLDGRSDLFSLGVVLYELLTGELPFKGTSDLSALEKIARAEFTPAIELNSSIPRRLASVVERAMARDPEQRYSCGTEMAADLERHLADENREVSPGGLSAYTRKLFRDDYIREMSRIKTFMAVDPRTAVPEAPRPEGEAREHRSTDPDKVVIEKTNVTPSQFLAAGYDASPELSAEVAAEAGAGFENEPSGEILLSAADVMVETPPRLTDKPAPFINLPDGEPVERTQAFKPLEDEPTPTSESLWDGDGAPSTDEILKPLDDALSVPEESTNITDLSANLADELEPTTEPEPVLDADGDAEAEAEPEPESAAEPEVDAGIDIDLSEERGPRDPAVHTDRVDGYAEDLREAIKETRTPSQPRMAAPPDITAPHPTVTADEAEGMFEAKTVEISTAHLRDNPEVAALLEQHRSKDTRDGGEARRIPSKGAEAEVEVEAEVELSDQNKTRALSAQQSEEVEIVDSSRAANLSDSLPAAATPSTRELGDKELEEIIEEVTDPGSTNPHAEAVPEPPPAADPLENLSPDDFDDIQTKARKYNIPKQADEPTRALKTPSGKHKAKPRGSQIEPAEEQPVLTPIPASGMRRRGRMLTDVEIAVLILAAALGMVAVVGTYWYAVTMPIERPRAMSAPMPGSTATAVAPESGQNRTR